ncbi:MAG: hypothetical protein AAFN30_14865, partial [Actinomycetota bacterium]
METATLVSNGPAAKVQPATGAGWSLAALGWVGITWWIWAWSKVDGLIDDHVSAWGPLPTSSVERAALYADGTPPQQQLSSDLEAITGLYPWGTLPLILAAIVALGGFGLALPGGRRLARLGIVVTVTLSPSHHQAPATTIEVTT